MKKKKKKAKPRIENTSKGDVAKQKIFNYYIKEMEEKTEEFNLKNESAQGTKFYLFQTIREKNKVRDMIFNLAYFYDNNFVGNKDFIHIPNISNILNNVQKYPIMIASKKDSFGTEEILGTATIKIENNDSIYQNPYFPTKNETVVSITGILTKLNDVNQTENRIKGIGKELFKSAIKAAYEINKNENIRLIFEVDCRNFRSLDAATKAVESLQKENLDIQMFVTGFYEIRHNINLVEAPTFILEIDLNGNKKISNNLVNFNYLNCESTTLFSDLNNVIFKNTKETKRVINNCNDKTVIYHSIVPINALNVKLEVGTTADGNDRVPVLKPLQLV